MYVIILVMVKKYWIMKSEPSEFSITDLAKKGETLWDGVRNYQVRNMFRDEMQVDDKVLFYHSSCDDVGVVGEALILKPDEVDPTQFKVGHKYYDAKSDKNSPRWLGPRVQFVSEFRHLVSLQKLREEKLFVDVRFVQKGNRLSVCQISKEQYIAIVKLGKG